MATQVERGFECIRRAEQTAQGRPKAPLCSRPWCRTSPACWRRSRGCSPRAGSTSTAWRSGETENPLLSRITVVVMGDDRHLEQVRKQLEKIVTVVKVHDISREDYVERDLMLIKIKAPAGRPARDPVAGADLSGPDRRRQPRPVDDRDLRAGEEDRGVHRGTSVPTESTSWPGPAGSPWCGETGHLEETRTSSQATSDPAAEDDDEPTVQGHSEL